MTTTNIPTEIRAVFKQANVKGVTTSLQFEIMTEDTNAFDIVRMSGKDVFLSIVEAQPQIVFVDSDGEVK